MKSFKELLKESYNGNFVVELNDGLIEVKVNYGDSHIVVEYFRTSKSIEPYKKESFISLEGAFFGRQTVEEKFNEIISNY